MTQTLLWALRRRLGALLRSATPVRTGANRPSPPPVRSDGGERLNDEHLRNVPDGAGCTEIWEHLSERANPDGEAQADD